MAGSMKWPDGRPVKLVTWGTSPENGDALAALTSDDAMVRSMVAQSTYHGTYDVPWIVQENHDGRLIWHNASRVDSIEWGPEPEAPEMFY